MDNTQIPPVQPAQPMQVDINAQQAQVQAQMQAQMQTQLAQPAKKQANPEKKKTVIELIKTIAIIFASLVAVTFIGLFIWKNAQYVEKSEDVDGQISAAVAKAKDEQAAKDEAEFLEREKYPFRTFSGPVDYGELTFQYPKTWSVYIAAAATSGGDFNAYLNPVQVDAVSKDTINALRVTIRNKSYDDVLAEYQKFLDRKDYDLTVESMTVMGSPASRYYGNIPNTELNGIIVVFKIRDKTAILQTDSVLFTDDFNKILESVKFNA